MRAEGSASDISESWKLNLAVQKEGKLLYKLSPKVPKFKKEALVYTRYLGIPKRPKYNSFIECEEEFYDDRLKS